MAYNIGKALRFIQRKLATEWAEIDFEYLLDTDEASATADITLNNHNDNIKVILSTYPSSMTRFRAVFDKLDMDYEELELVNLFNADSIFFRACIREDGYLELDHVFYCYKEADIADYSNEFMCRLSNLADDEILQRITALTHE